jgi:hypothetical protein
MGARQSFVAKLIAYDVAVLTRVGVLAGISCSLIGNLSLAATRVLR